jgi:periplasmic divalent cation tolerance protein
MNPESTNLESIRLVFVTFPDLTCAREIGTAMVQSQLAACVNLLPAVESIYRWQSRIESSKEVLGLFKTTEASLRKFEARLKEMHPYDVPELIAMKPEHVAEMYARWVGESVV